MSYNQGTIVLNNKIRCRWIGDVFSS